MITQKSQSIDANYPGAEEPIFYQQAETALQELDRLLGKNHPAAMEAVVQMIDLMISKNRRFIFYLGAGCSEAVEVKGRSGIKFPSWKELLKEIYMEKLTPAQRDVFLKVMTRRAGLSEASPIKKFDELFPYFERPQVASFLSWFFRDRGARDEAIRKIVEPMQGLEYVSPLHTNLLSLPFDDIVTTNYDSLIKHFLDVRFKPQLDREEIPYIEIKDFNSLVKSFNAIRTRRLIYLHGKVPLSESDKDSRLIFDRFDYANLVAERDGMLDYVTNLLRDSHVIYVGFGLDDLTFNLMESRLQALQGSSRPQSFAFIPFVTEPERKEWAGRRLDIIDYEAHKDLPQILKFVLTVLKFVNEAEPERPVGGRLKRDRTEDYMPGALELYVSGDYENSLRECRAALASTIFWDREMPSDTGDSPVLPFKDAARVCEIRIRLALNRYKLQWGPNRSDQDHYRYIMENIEAADKIIKVWEKRFQTAKGHQQIEPGECALLALKKSLQVLQARISYLEGQFRKALEQYTNVADKRTEQAKKIKPHDNKETVIWKLKLSEAYYYAKCQISRIDYQFLGETRDGLKGKREQVKEMEKAAEAIKKVRVFIAQTRRHCGELSEWKYFHNSMGTIYRIARWTAGRHMIRICQDVIPTKQERSQDAYDQLTEGINLLVEEPKEDEQNVWKLSPRWLAYRYRYQCRAYALRWVISQQPGIGPGSSGDGDLIDAYEAIQMALEGTVGSGLERHRMINLLEATRLNILVMFGEKINLGKQERVARFSPLSFGAGLHYLDMAFQEIARVEQLLCQIEQSGQHTGKEGHLSWLRILGYRLASYFALVLGQMRQNEIQRVHNQDLKSFLKLDARRMSKRVEQGYSEFAENFGKPNALNTRISYYTQTLKTISEELAAK